MFVGRSKRTCEQRTTNNEQRFKMNINRHNYEEFFLLYVDNELSAEERNAVEVFVQENADLKKELLLLHQTVINTDAVVFENKNSLFKKEISPLQENLLLYLDNELSAADKISTQQLLKTDAVASVEFSILQQTKLQADTAVVFAGKKVLYRKEEGKVVRFPWLRVAAAAVLLGFGTWVTVSVILTNTKTSGGTVVINETKGAPPTTPTVVTPITNTPQPAAPQNTIADNNTIAEKKIENAVKEIVPKNNPSSQVNYKQGLPVKKGNNNIAVQNDNKKPGNNLPRPDYNNFNNNQSNETVAANVTPPEEATNNLNSGDKTAVAASNEKVNNQVINPYALNTNFKQDNAEEEDNAIEDKSKKTKLGGFLRKVKRLVERNTNVKTGNGIKVAGFDIAIK